MIVIVDFGGQYTRLIERAVQELNVAVRVAAPVDVDTALGDEVRGIILSGSPASVNILDLARVRSLGDFRSRPVLGICYGHQLLAAEAGGTVAQQSSREYGKARLHCSTTSRLWRDVPQESLVWMSHGDTVVALSDAWMVIGTTQDGAHAAIEARDDLRFGVQFHPEVTQTQAGTQILRNFVVDICGETPSVTLLQLRDRVIGDICAHVGNCHILTACSLGVDSTTLAIALQQALGSRQVHPIFVNNGLLRQEDFDCLDAVRAVLPNLQVVDATDQFLEALRGVTDPEEKRRRIGRTFWAVFDAAARALQGQHTISVFSQGTIAPDAIESGAKSAKSATIKTHHNLVKPPPDFPFTPFEPFVSLYKDQVRMLGRSLDVPERILRRHPFPGPGLAVRIIGEVTPRRLRIAREADAIFLEALRRAELYDQISQALVGITADCVVGVRGDARAYGCVAMLRAVVTRDFMTADVFQFPHGFIEDVSTAIVNQVDGIAHVVLSTTRKPPATVEFE